MTKPCNLASFRSSTFSRMREFAFRPGSAMKKSSVLFLAVTLLSLNALMEAILIRFVPFWEQRLLLKVCGALFAVTQCVWSSQVVGHVRRSTLNSTLDGSARSMLGNLHPVTSRSRFLARRKPNVSPGNSVSLFPNPTTK